MEKKTTTDELVDWALRERVAVVAPLDVTVVHPKAGFQPAPVPVVNRRFTWTGK